MISASARSSNAVASRGRSVQTEQVIREAALRVWSKHGYSRATLKRIGEASGLGEPTLLRHFGRRAEILRSAFSHELEKLCDELRIDGDLYADITGLVEEFGQLLRFHGRIVLDLILEEPRNNEASALLTVAMKALRRAASVIAYHQSAGALRGSNPWEPMLALLGPFIVLALHRDPQMQPSAFVNFNIDEFLSGWRREPMPASGRPLDGGL